MLTREQISKVSRLEQQTGEFDGFYEPNFDKWGRMALKCQEKGKHVIKLKLICVELLCGDVVIQRG